MIQINIKKIDPINKNVGSNIFLNFLYTILKKKLIYFYEINKYGVSSVETGGKDNDFRLSIRNGNIPLKSIQSERLIVFVLETEARTVVLPFFFDISTFYHILR